jgi:hypothetical protein
VTYFKDLASGIKGLDAVKGAAAFQNTFPGRNFFADEPDQFKGSGGD